MKTNTRSRQSKREGGQDRGRRSTAERRRDPAHARMISLPPGSPTHMRPAMLFRRALARTRALRRLLSLARPCAFVCKVADPRQPLCGEAPTPAQEHVEKGPALQPERLALHGTAPRLGEGRPHSVAGGDARRVHGVVRTTVQLGAALLLPVLPRAVAAALLPRARPRAAQARLRLVPSRR